MPAICHRKITVMSTMDLAGKSATSGDSVSTVKSAIVPRRGLSELLSGAARVTEVSAPAGSGKTTLVRSWIGEAGLADQAAWVSVPPQEGDAQRFWVSVLDALRGTAAGSVLVRDVTTAPGLDTGELVERLLHDLGSLEDRVWLVVDDVHELASAEALRQLELLMMRAPPQLRFVLLTRHDLRLGLHRLRLEGGLTEIRAGDLRFTPQEARALFAAAVVGLPDSVLSRLHERTEGWAAGLRLAALSLSGHPDPARFAEEFSGSERTVADYLLAEVLERQSEEVRRLLLRTSILERVNGELADLLTGSSGGARVLQELEAVNAFVASVDARRTWFRYHRLFADLLRLELRTTAPGELAALHAAAAGWFAGHRHPVEAIRHAQAAGDWCLAARLLSDEWLSLALDGQQDTAHQLLTGFPSDVGAGDPELMALAADDERNRGSLETADRCLASAARELASVPAQRRGRLQVTLGILRLSVARQRGDVPAAAEEAQQLLAPVEAADGADLGMSGERRALALISLGIAETWAYRSDEAERHLEQGVVLARHIRRPYLELTGLAHSVAAASFRSYTAGVERGRQAIELAERHGWSEESITGVAYARLAGVMVGQGQLDEAERWFSRAGRALRVELEPAAGINMHLPRAVLELVRGRTQRALDAVRAAEELAGQLRTPYADTAWMRGDLLHILVRVGQTNRVEAALSEMSEQELDTAIMRSVIAALRLAGNEPREAAVALAPVIDGSLPTSHPTSHPMSLVRAFLLEAIARDALGDRDAAARALERALDFAEPDSVRMPFLFYPAPALLERHARQRTAHGALISQILGLLAGSTSPVADSNESVPPSGEPRSPRDPLSPAEIRVLRYLPTSLTVPEIAGQLYLSVNTVRTHMRHVYDKLDAHRRHEALERARAIGLLAASGRES